MKIKLGRHWQDLGPGSSASGLTGHHSAFTIALEAESPTGLPAAASGAFRCGVCNEPCLPGRYACSADHQKLAYGNRGFGRG